MTELPILSDQEEVFANELWLGTPQVEAYRKAYGAEGYNPNSLAVRACRKAGEQKIQNYVRHLKSVTVHKTALTMADRIADELAFAMRAERAGNFGAAGGAHDRVNKMLGHYIERMEVIGADPMASLREIAAIHPELARQLAQSSGLDWNGTEH